MGAGCGAGAGAERRSQWVHFWGWKWEQGRSPVPGRAAPSPPPQSSLFSLLPNGFFQGVPVWLTLGAVLRDPRFGRSPSRSPSPVPLCQSQQGRGSPAWKSEGGGLISHTRSVNPNLFGVPYSAPLSPLCPTQGVLPSAAPARPFHVPPLSPSDGLQCGRGFERTL